MQACFSDQINPPIDPDRPDPPRATVAVYVVANLREFNIKLNPEKCTFGVPKGKLLGYMVSEHGFEANRDKIAAITNMRPIEVLRVSRG